MRKILLLLLLSVSFSLFSQSVTERVVQKGDVGKTLSVYLTGIEQATGIHIFYVGSWIESTTLQEDHVGLSLQPLLDQIFLGTDLNYIFFNSNTLVLVKDPAQALQRDIVISKARREQKKIDKLVIGDSLHNGSARKVKLSGMVRDAKSKEPMIGVSIFVTDTKTGVVTNVEGRFELTLLTGNHIINFSSINFEEKIVDLVISKDGSIVVDLEEAPTVLEEIIVQDRAAREITTSGIGQIQLSIKEIKRAPALLGEVDLIRQIQTLPGVTTAGEAASGYNVRGGSVDQNLILYDGLPVFNSSHVFGFFSTFNAEAVRDVSFYRGGIPAEFGGRVSSVLDIRSNEGSYDKWGGSGGIGLISSNLMVNGPISKGKTAIIASVRSTYSDWLINTVRSNYINLQNSSVSFYDASAKITHLFSKKTKLTWSGYLSNDKFRLQGDSSFQWTTGLTSLKLDHEFSKKLTAAFLVGVGNYNYNVNNRDSLTGFDLKYNLTYPSARADFHWQGFKHKANFGWQGIYYGFNPGSLIPTSPESSVKEIHMEKQQSTEMAFYGSDEFSLGKHFHLNAGLRFSIFNSIGPGSVNVYKPGMPLETLNLIDTLQFSKGESMKLYYGVEPRFSFRYEISPNASIKIGYNRIYQYLHLVTNTTAVTPVDIWQPSGYYYKPQMADQFSIGYFTTSKEKMYDAFVEVYYKEINNVLDFKDGAQLILNPQLETDLLQGKARAYGAEFQISKTIGRLVGSFSYAYSRSLRTITGSFPGEEINGGKEYPSNFDQPNVINVGWKYNITRRYFFTGGFTYHTGRPVTLPLSAFTVDNITISAFSDRNQFRIPDYHRLDLGLVFEGSHKRKKILDGTWTFSLYNVYGRKNAYSVFFKEVRPGILRPYQLAIIGTVVPSLSYSFKI